jgi:hypothetical protein
MKCSDVLTRLDDLMDGTVASGERAAVEGHLESCAGCRSEVEARSALRCRVDELARWVEPSRDLWPGIAHRIERQKVVPGRFGSRARRYVLTAAAAAVVAAALLAAYTVGRQHSEESVQAMREVTPAVVTASFKDTSLGAVEAEFRHARTELMAILEQRRHELSPETLWVVDSNLRLIDDAIEEITIALGQDPDNPQLTHRLAAVYRQQIELLRTATGLPSEI